MMTPEAIRELRDHIEAWIAPLADAMEAETHPRIQARLRSAWSDLSTAADWLEDAETVARAPDRITDEHEARQLIAAGHHVETVGITDGYGPLWELRR